MNENQNNMQYYEDEIDLKELIMALWKRKKMIISLTIAAALLAGAFSMFVLSPVYNTKLNIVISMPEKYNTRYGEYTLPISTNDQYINLIYSNDVLLKTIDAMGYEGVTVENLKKRVAIAKNEAKTGVQNSFEITVSADNPDESCLLAQTLFDNYVDFLDSMTKERAVNYYINNFTVTLRALENSLESQKEILKNNEELLSQIPKIIDAGNANLEVTSQLYNGSGYTVPIDTANPNYIKVENDIIENKQSIGNLENSIMMENKYLEELKIEKQTINEYFRTGKSEKLEASVIGVVDSNIYLPSPPVAPTQKSSPRNSLNAAIGAVLGGMLAVMIALVQEYWFSKAN